MWDSTSNLVSPGNRLDMERWGTRSLGTVRLTSADECAYERTVSDVRSGGSRVFSNAQGDWKQQRRQNKTFRRNNHQFIFAQAIDGCPPRQIRRVKMVRSLFLTSVWLLWSNWCGCVVVVVFLLFFLFVCFLTSGSILFSLRAAALHQCSPSFSPLHHRVIQPDGAQVMSADG